MPLQVVVLCLCIFCDDLRADIITLYIPIVEESPQQHLFYHELLTTAITEAGHTPNLVIQRLPQPRIKNYLEHGLISLYWMIESEQRNQRYQAIEVGLTNKLIGQRVLFIKQGEQPLYEKVQNLDDFRALNFVASMGKDWFDAAVWKENNLAYSEYFGNWQQIFRTIERGTRHNYFPRSVTEVLTETVLYPNLEIEQRLLLIYDRDFRFYLSKQGPQAGIKYEQILKQALVQALESGLITRLINKYWGDDFKKLNYDQRIKLYLKTPK